MLASSLYRFNVFAEVNSNSGKRHSANYLGLVQTSQARFSWVFPMEIMKLLLQVAKVRGWLPGLVFIIIITLPINSVLEFATFPSRINDFANMILPLFRRSIANRVVSLAVNPFHLVMIMKVGDMKDIVYLQPRGQF